MTRKSKRELERALDDLGVRDDRYPQASMCVVLSAESIEPVDPDRHLWRLDGEVYYIPVGIRDTIQL